MIHLLRRRHGSLVLAVAVVVPLLAVLAIAMRPKLPIMPAASAPPATGSWTPIGPDGQVHALVETDSSREWLLLVRDQEFAVPDVLVYWSSATAVDGLPEDAVLLGALGDTGRNAFDLPLGDTSGTVFLYSLAHGVTIAAVPVDRIHRLGGRR